MKKYMAALTSVIGVAAIVFLTGFNEVAVYRGVVQLVQADAITIIKTNGGESKCKVNGSTRVFISGKLFPASRIKPYSHVQFAVDRNNVCLQIVVEEMPK